MSSKIKSLSVLTIALAGAFIFASCKSGNSDETNKANDPSAGAAEQAADLADAKKIYGESAVNVIRGHFSSDPSALDMTAMLEISSDTTFGIEFAHLRRTDGSVKEVFKTKMLDGSFNESKTKKMNLPGISNDLVYYNSQDYYLGSGGGDIYAYIVDFASKEIYSAHFFSYETKPTSLYISPNTTNEEVKNFFINEFKALFPELKIVNSDYNYYEELY